MNANIPKFFATKNLPSVAKWAMDKIKTVTESSLDCEGRNVKVRNLYFEGKFGRKPTEFFAQWDCPSEGKQFSCTVRSHGGHYKGEKPLISVCFSEYASDDGMPLPIT